MCALNSAKKTCKQKFAHMWVIPADTKIIARNKTVFKNKIYN